MLGLFNIFWVDKKFDFITTIVEYIILYTNTNGKICLEPFHKWLQFLTYSQARIYWMIYVCVLKLSRQLQKQF